MNQTHTTPQIAKDIVWRLLDDNAVVVSPREGEVRVLNNVGTVIWQMLIDNKDLPAIEKYLESNYEIAANHAHADLLTFLEELTDRGILIWDRTA